MGRFMSPDWAAKPATVPYAEFGDPQSLNLYSYTRNSPIVRIDGDGHDANGMLARPGQGGILGSGALGDGDNPFADQDRVMWANAAGAIGIYQNVTVDSSSTGHLESAQNQTQDKAQVKVGKQTYEASSRGAGKGVKIKLDAKVRAGGYKHLNWVQKITTNAPLGNNPANQPYVDRDPGQQSPFYLNPEEQGRFENIVPGPMPSTTSFEDDAIRVFSGNAISWHADLSLVGIKNDGTFDTLKTFSYGFTLDAQGVHLDPLTGVQ
jgi:hypothetical protein